MTEMITTLPYGIRGEHRKDLVKAVSEYRETFSEYCGAPTFDYVVGDILIDKEGKVIFTSKATEEDLQGLKEYLASKGFVLPGEEATLESEAAGLVQSEEERQEASEETEEPKEMHEQQSDGTGEATVNVEGRNRLTIELPREGFTETALKNLRKIVDSKASLLKKVLETDVLTVEVTEDRIRFPWFMEPEDSTISGAYTHLVSAIGEMARSAKRVTAVDRPVESEKYSFRVWLLRLGFVGAEYKHERAILMKNLSGHTAFKSQADADAFAEKQRSKREAMKANQNHSDSAANKQGFVTPGSRR